MSSLKDNGVGRKVKSISLNITSLNRTFSYWSLYIYISSRSRRFVLSRSVRTLNAYWHDSETLGRPEW